MMKETPIFEEVFSRLVRLPGFWLKLLIGSMLSFVPILNFFALGYLYRVSRATGHSGQPAMPAWPEVRFWQAWSAWAALWLDGLRLLVVWLVYWLLPVLLAAGVAGLLSWIALDVLGYVIFLGVVLLACGFFGAALYRYNRRRDFRDLLDAELIFRMTWLGLPRLMVAALVFLGLFAWWLPFYGFAFFGGFLLLITYTTLRYRSLELQKTTAR
jgi:hypothetical protein